MPVRIWEVVTDSYMRLGNYADVIRAHDIITSLDVSAIDDTEERTLYEMYISKGNGIKELLDELYEYLDTLSESAFRSLPVIHGTSQVITGYIILSYMSGKMSIDSLRRLTTHRHLFTGQPYRCIGQALTAIVRLMLQKGEDVSDIMNMISNHHVPNFDVVRAIVAHGKQEHFEWVNQWLKEDFHGYITQFLDYSLKISEHRLREVVHHIQHITCNVLIVFHYTEHNKSINNNIMSLLLELLGNEDMIMNNELSMWIEKMRGSEV